MTQRIKLLRDQADFFFRQTDIAYHVAKGAEILGDKEAHVKHRDQFRLNLKRHVSTLRDLALGKIEGLS